MDNLSLSRSKFTCAVEVLRWCIAEWTHIIVSYVTLLPWACINDKTYSEISGALAAQNTKILVPSSLRKFVLLLPAKKNLHFEQNQSLIETFMMSLDPRTPIVLVDFCLFAEVNKLPPLSLLLSVPSLMGIHWLDRFCDQGPCNQIVSSMGLHRAW